MEGEVEESDEDVQAEDRPTVLWEKCIQQSIFIDLSEDESLHLSDLESPLALHLSQAESAASETSVHLSGSAQLSGLDITSSESSTASGQSGSVVEDNNKSSMLPVSAKRPNTIQDDPPLKQNFEDPGQNTSDEDQDDLPYDGDLGSSYFNQTANSESNTSSEGRETVHASPDVPHLLEYNTRNDVFDSSLFDGHNPERPGTLLQEHAHATQENMLDASKPCDVPLLCPGPTDIHQLLLRHFSQEELLRSGRLIEAETLPEVSLLESVDDTVLSYALMHSSARINTNSSDNPACNSEISQSFHSDRADQKSKTASKSSSSDEERGRTSENVTPAADSLASNSASTDSKQGSVNTSNVEAVKQTDAEEDDEVQRVPLLRTKSFSEMKYGQGQVHYPLPDFSKVAPKVKIPKAASGPVRPVLQGPSSIHRAQSSPGMLDLVSRVLEDSVLPAEKPYVFKDESTTPPALVHHLQAEYGKLLTKYAEAENLIDQMRLGTNVQASPDPMLDLECEHDHQENLTAIDGNHPGTVTPHRPPPGNLGEKGKEKETGASRSNIKEVKEVDAASSSPPEEEPTDGERMTAELRDIIIQYMQKVEEFKVSVRNMSVSTAEQQMMLRSIMEAQDQLERKYMSKKEEHRALEMQNYMGLSRNTGTFDPNRLVEGDIFRLGMHIEDIKEMIDQNVCEQISPPLLSSTPTALKAALLENPSPVCMPTPSPASTLHEGLSAVFSTVGFITETQKDGSSKDLEEQEEASEVHRDDGLQHSRFSAPSCFRSSQGSVECLDLRAAGAAEEETSSVLLEAIDHSNILAYLDGCSSSPRLRQRTPDSCSTPDSVVHPVGERDLGDCVSLAVEVSMSSDAHRDSNSTTSFSEPPVNTSSVSQRIVSPETDSGFGSSYLNQSASGSFQQSLHTESAQSQSSALGSSDSEGSCSNLQTTIHPVSLSSRHSIHTQASGAAASVERWVESTTKKPSVRLQNRTTSSLHHHVSEPILSSTMDADERGSPLHSCSCNSEAIVALQSEVSRLKKDLEEGLVQLPHLAQKMDYLTSKYRHEREQRRSKSRTRSHLRASCNSDLKSSSRQNENSLSSNQVKIEDWISTDMDPSKSKGTDSGDTAGSEILLHSLSSPVGSRRISVDMQHKHHGTLQSRGGSEGNCTVSTAALKGGKEEASDSRSKLGPQTVVESFYSKERWSALSSPSLQKPLLQVSYTSSSSLPASYKLRELQLEPTPHHRERSTQSDTALLPSNVYFQRTVSPGWLPPKAGSRTGRRRGSKDEDMNRTLDRAIEVARHMKRTTDRMAKRLSADLAKAQLHRKLHSSSGPLGGRKHHAL